MSIASVSLNLRRVGMYKDLQVNYLNEDRNLAQIFQVYHYMVLQYFPKDQGIFLCFG
jgi:hypothetical protein